MKPKMLIYSLLAGLSAQPALMAQPVAKPVRPKVESPALPVVKPESAPAATPVPKQTRVLGLVQVGPIEEEMVERTRKFIEFNLGLVVRRLESQDPVGGNLKHEGAALKRYVKGDVFKVIGIVAADKDVKQVSALLHEDGIAVVNGTVLKHENKETYGRRLERSVIRNYSFLLGLSSSPNPQSALFPYRTIAQLDTIGRNLDPPFLSQLQKDALANGLTFVDYPALVLIDTGQQVLPKLVPPAPKPKTPAPKKPKVNKKPKPVKKPTQPIFK